MKLKLNIACASAVFFLVGCSPSDQEIISACEGFKKNQEPVYLTQLGIKTHQVSQVSQALKKDSIHFVTDCHKIVSSLI